MLKLRRLAAAVVIVVSMLSAAHAQRAPISPEPTKSDPHIDITIQFHLPVAVERADQEKAHKLFEEARRRIYELAASECAYMLATIASTCELKRFNLTTHVPAYASAQLQPGQIGASATYRIKPRPTSVVPDPKP